MAHFARLDENNIVTMIAVVANSDMVDENGKEVESLGVAVCERVIGPGPWIQTSYNSNFRKQYAGIGFTYNATGDVFVEPKPLEFPSWILNADYDWEPPIPRPEGNYGWNEETQSWEEGPTGEIPIEEPAP